MRNKWIAHGRISENAKVNLICFPYPGGSAGIYAKWKNFLSDEINICPVLFPMRETRYKEKMPNTVDELVESFIEDNKELFSINYSIFGYCAGAAIGYEVAIKVKQLLGKEPGCFIAASAEAPMYIKNSIVVNSCLTPQDSIEMLKQLRKGEEVPIEDPIFADYYLPITIADSKLLLSYKLEKIEKFNFDVIALYAEDDIYTVKEKVEEWKEVTDGKCTFYTYPGNHFFVEKHLEDVCDMIQLSIKDRFKL